ncbi:MAG: hypothetical protein Q8T03_12190 [Bacteroidota bacterium]|nr:hypothetical protein [Bacteroidota bacterium]
MFKLDRNAHSSGKITDFKKESDNYKYLTIEEIGKVFAYLQSVAYNYSLDKPLKMDKTIFSARLLKIKNDNKK